MSQFKASKKTLPKDKTWFDLQLQRVPVQYYSKKKVAVIDCDGIITDGTSGYDRQQKSFKIYGSYDKQMLSFLGSILKWRLIFVSDDKAGLQITKSRIAHLMKKNPSIQFMNLSSHGRLQLLKSFISDDTITLFVGDSISDIPSLSLADLSGTSSNAPDVVKEYCNYISSLEGGHGALADILYKAHQFIVESSRDLSKKEQIQ